MEDQVADGSEVVPVQADTQAPTSPLKIDVRTVSDLENSAAAAAEGAYIGGDYEPHKEHHLGANLPAQSLRKAYFNTLIVMLGVGLLGMPATVAQGGWAVLILMPLLVVMACYSARLLTDALYVDVAEDGTGRKHAGYPEVAERVLGQAGLVVTHFAMKAVLLTVSAVMTFLGSDLARQVSNDLNYGHDGAPADADADAMRHTAIIVFCCLALVPILGLPSLNEVGFLSMLGALATFAAAVVVFVIAATHHGCAHGAEGCEDGDHAFFNASAFGDGFGAIVLGLGGASTMPGIEKEMSPERRVDPDDKKAKSREEWAQARGGGPGAVKEEEWDRAQVVTDPQGAAPYKRVLNYVFATLGFLFMVIAFNGYYVYGDTVAGLVLDSLPTKGAYLYVLMVIKMGLIGNVFVTNCLIVFILSEEVERKVFGIARLGELTFREHMFSKHTAPRLVCRALFILWGFLAAYFVPNFFALCNLAGSFCVFTVYVIPCCFAVVLHRQGVRKLSAVQLLWIALIVVVSVTGFVFGFKAAIKQIHDAFGSSSSPPSPPVSETGGPTKSVDNMVGAILW